jgi:hypothetical protein
VSLSANKKLHDAAGSLIIQPKRMRKADLINDWNDWNMPSSNKTVNSMQADLEKWKIDQCDKVSQGNWPFIELDSEIEKTYCCLCFLQRS